MTAADKYRERLMPGYNERIAFCSNTLPVTLGQAPSRDSNDKAAHSQWRMSKERCIIGRSTGLIIGSTDSLADTEGIPQIPQRTAVGQLGSSSSVAHRCPNLISEGSHPVLAIIPTRQCRLSQNWSLVQTCDSTPRIHYSRGSNRCQGPYL